MSTQERNAKVSFMLPPSLHRRLRIAAAEEGVRLSALVADILTEELDFRDGTASAEKAVADRFPNAETEAALREAKTGGGARFGATEELMRDLGDEDDNRD